MLDVLGAILAILIIVLIWIMLFDTNRFVARRFEISDRRIRRPVRAVVLADLHNKRYGKNNERLLEEIRAQKPDLILVAGDILTAKRGASFEPAVNLIRELSRDFPLYYGNGNHEHRLKLYPKVYGDMGERYGKALEEAGVRPLVNSHAVLADFGIAVYGSEIGKEYYKRFRIREMEAGYLEELLGRPEEGLYTVLLAHNPDYFPRYAAWGADLTLSGHVHGGVARVPFWGKGVVSPGFRLFPKYDGGVFREGQAVMILSRGLGSHTIPFRLFNPGELWVVELKPDSEQGNAERINPEQANLKRLDLHPKSRHRTHVPLEKRPENR
ncbi:MAG: metallophosphoesterase [Roseburia sp.]|nr:metallophosphoesterase [Roseburia sp.]MCM1097317.1 metallophosphoesterase [Ruminococcus flavefaciens]